MPHSLILNIIPQSPIYPNFLTGRHYHALFLNLVSSADRKLGDYLHESNADKAFTLSPLQVQNKHKTPQPNCNKSGRSPLPLIYAQVAEGLGAGLQNRVRGFKSLPELNISPHGGIGIHATLRKWILQVRVLLGVQVFLNNNFLY